MSSIQCFIHARIWSETHFDLLKIFLDLFNKYPILVSVERWCRLRGNLLFYFRSRDQWSEPAGVIVLEAVVEVTEDNTGTVLDSGTFGFILNFCSGPSQYLSCFTKADRDSWRTAIESASHTSASCIPSLPRAPSGSCHRVAPCSWPQSRRRPSQRSAGKPRCR